MDETWHDVATLDDFAATDAIGVRVGQRQIAIYLVGGEVFATDNHCTHGDAFLCEGFVEGHEIECPRHQGRFDIRTGQATLAPATTALATYAVRVEGIRVQLRL